MYQLTEIEMQAIKDEAIKNGTFMKAPNGKPTNLNERQWLQVRTKAFKDWFGDWEKVCKKEMILSLKPTPLTHKSLSKEELVNTYKSLKNGKNKYDGRNVEFVHGSLGKILRHQGFDYARLIPQLKEIFDNSVPAYSEDEISKEGHKQHSNFVGYHNYVGKISDNGREYFVRFTVQEIRTNPSKRKPEGFTPNQLHSANVTDVEIYKTDLNPVNSQIIDRATDDEAGYKLDTKLQKFFEEANEAEKNSSKIVDENGEPSL